MMDKFSLYLQNMHIHSYLSGCAKSEMTPGNIMANARRLKEIAIIDHVDKPGTKRAKRIIKEHGLWIKSGVFDSDGHGTSVHLGCETSQVSPGEFSISDEDAVEMDLVAVACNHYHLKYVERPEDGDLNKHHIKMLFGAIAWQYTDVIVHPFWHHKLKDGHKPDYSDEDIADIMYSAKVRNVFFELNPYLICEHPEFFRRVVGIGSGYGDRFVVGTDAHRLRQIDIETKDLEILADVFRTKK